MPTTAIYKTLLKLEAKKENRSIAANAKSL